MAVKRFLVFVYREDDEFGGLDFIYGGSFATAEEALAKVERRPGACMELFDTHDEKFQHFEALPAGGRSWAAH